MLLTLKSDVAHISIQDVCKTLRHNRRHANAGGAVDPAFDPA